LLGHSPDATELPSVGRPVLSGVVPASTTRIVVAKIERVEQALGPSFILHGWELACLPRRGNGQRADPRRRVAL